MQACCDFRHASPPALPTMGAMHINCGTHPHMHARRHLLQGAQAPDSSIACYSAANLTVLTNAGKTSSNASIPVKEGLITVNMLIENAVGYLCSEGARLLGLCSVCRGHSRTCTPACCPGTNRPGPSAAAPVSKLCAHVSKHRSLLSNDLFLVLATWTFTGSEAAAGAWGGWWHGSGWAGLCGRAPRVQPDRVREPE